MIGEMENPATSQCSSGQVVSGRVSGVKMQKDKCSRFCEKNGNGSDEHVLQEEHRWATDKRLQGGARENVAIASNGKHPGSLQEVWTSRRGSEFRVEEGRMLHRDGLGRREECLHFPWTEERGPRGGRRKYRKVHKEKVKQPEKRVWTQRKEKRVCIDRAERWSSKGCAAG